MNNKNIDKRPSLDEQWNEDPKTYDGLIKTRMEIEQSLDRCLNKRTELFQKMKIDDIDEQQHLVDLIQNIVLDRELYLTKVQNDLEISFTPRIGRMLNINGK